MTESRPDASATSGPTRRQVLRGGTAVVVGAGVSAALTGCATGVGGDKESGMPRSSGQPVGVPKADVPVGAGVILPKAPYVVTQPTQGQFKAFTKVCPHQGCNVSLVRNNAIVCACHSSYFALTDGSPTQGPARQGLKEVAVVDNGDTLLVG